MGKEAPLFFVGLAFILAMVLAGASRAYATPATFIVNSTGDGSDVNTNDNVCDADSGTVGN